MNVVRRCKILMHGRATALWRIVITLLALAYCSDEPANNDIAEAMGATVTLNASNRRWKMLKWHDLPVADQMVLCW